MTERADAAWHVAVESALKDLELRCLELGRAQGQGDVMSYGDRHELLADQRKHIHGLLGIRKLVNLEFDITRTEPRLWIDGTEMPGGKDVQYLQCWAGTYYLSGVPHATREEAVSSMLACAERKALGDRTQKPLIQEER